MNAERGTPSYTRKGQADSPTALLDMIASPRDLRDLAPDDLPRLAEELRRDVIDTVSQTGGHLGAGLGVVELTVALHYVFDTPRDKLIWDVSHQCYPHKILTGRRADMRRVRKGGGPSGFTNRRESVFDPFGAAHSSTSISAALGFAAARDFKGADNHVVAVIGDGAITGGMAYEALNNAGEQHRRLIVILNDNDMSIAPPAGALQHHLGALRAAMPHRQTRARALAGGPGLPSFADGETLFEALGVDYAGPFDGHDIAEMLAVLDKAKRHDGPLVVHVVTRKGKGYAPAEASGDCYHGVGKFNVATGALDKTQAAAPSYTAVFAEALIAQAKADPAIVAVNAAMPSGTGLNKFAQVFPERCFDTGIAEQHAVTFCAGLAADGAKPFAAIYSTFLQRGYDQIVHDVAIQSLPVRFAIDRAGMVGADGVTHQGSYDIAYLGCLPGFVLMAAGDEAELAHMVATAASIDDRPSALRYPRGTGVGVPLPDKAEALAIGEGRVLRQGDRVALLSYGSRLADTLAAAEMLSAHGIEATVADARFAKPIDDRLVRRLAREHEAVLTIEEGAIGGFAAQVFDSLQRQGLDALKARVRALHLPDFFIDHDSQDAQIARAGLCRQTIVKRALALCGANGRRMRDFIGGVEAAVY